jgi:DNA-directed RNA polymerase beta subunit
MGANMSNQAVELLNPDQPFISSGNQEDIIDHPLNIKSQKKGVVEYVDSNKVIVKNDDGTKSEYFSKFLNAMYDLNISMKSVVKVGDPVTEISDIFIPRNLNGGLSLGKNCRVAFMLHGNNYEDGVIVGSHKLEEFQHVSIKDYTYILKPDAELTSLPKIGEDIKEGDNLIGVNERMTSEDLEFISRAVNYGKSAKKSFYITEGLRVPLDFEEGFVSDVVIRQGITALDGPSELILKNFNKSYNKDRLDFIKNVKLNHGITESYSSQVIEKDFHEEVLADHKLVIKIRVLHKNKLKIGNKITNR